jgi:uncharacterized protein DUF1801
MAENKTKPTPLSVTTFVNDIADETKRAGAKTLIKLMQGATDEKPAMWGSAIIGFGKYHYAYESGREGDMPLVGFSPRKAAFVLYGAANFNGADALLSKLGKYTKGKGCLYLKTLADVDVKVLDTLIKKAVVATRAKHQAKS